MNFGSAFIVAFIVGICVGQVAIAYIMRRRTKDVSSLSEEAMEFLERINQK